MLPLHRKQLAERYQAALALQQRGDLDAALAAYEAIVATNPDLAEAWFQIGQIRIKQDRPADALAPLQRAAELKPTERALWAVQAEAVFRLGDEKQANAFLRRAKAAKLPHAQIQQYQAALKPKPAKSKVGIGTVPPKELQRAIALLNAGRARDAADLAARLRGAHPGVAILADIHATALAATGQDAKAEAEYHAAIKLDPNYAETRVNYGRFLLSRDRVEQAAAALAAATKRAPHLPDAWTELGRARGRLGQPRQAVEAWERSLALNGKQPGVHMDLIRTLLDLERPLDAQRLLAPMRRGAPDAAAALVLSGRVQAMLGNLDAAVEEFDAAIAHAPDDPAPLMAKAQALQSAGAFDAAQAVFREALDRAPEDGAIYQSLTMSYRAQPGDPLIDRMEALWARDDIGGLNRAHLGFALSKAHEDARQYDRVFHYLRPANDLIRAQFPFDMGAARAEAEAQLRAFDGVNYEARVIEGATDYAPIFVAGLPRSGTTLVEQILASHSKVTGGGELGDLRREWAGAVQPSSGRLRAVSEMPDAEIAEIGHRAEAAMRARFPDATHLTDKSVLTYSVLGGVALSMPRARLLVVRRDPRDMAVSMYKNLFAMGQHRYSNALADLAAYYRLFEDTLAFWRARLPGRLHEVHYEALVADPEAETRALVAAAGLDWEDACLEFHNNTRQVSTLSLHQVRQPIYASSKAAWRRYEDELGELLDGLGPPWAAEAE